MKQRRRQKRQGFLDSISKAVKQRKSEIKIADILEGKSGLSPAAVEAISHCWQSLCTTPEYELIHEARQLGYPLKKLVDFYISEHEKPRPDSDFVGLEFDGISHKEATENNIAYLKSCTTWADFEVIAETMKDAPPDDMFPFVPSDLVMLIFDARMVDRRDKSIRENVSQMSKKEVVAFLNVEEMRKHKGVSLEKSAHIAEMQVDAYKAFLEALQQRADSNDEIRKDVHEFKRMCQKGAFDRQ